MWGGPHGHFRVIYLGLISTFGARGASPPPPNPRSEAHSTSQSSFDFKFGFVVATHRNNVGRDDKDCLQSLKNSPNSSTSARRGRNRNGSNLHDCLRVHKSNYMLKFGLLIQVVHKRQGNGAPSRRALQFARHNKATNSQFNFISSFR